MVVSSSRHQSLTQTEHLNAAEPRVVSTTIPRKAVPQRQADVLDNDGKDEQKLISGSPPEASTDSWRERHILSFWWREILSCLLAVSMLCIIIAVLYPRRGLPLPHWPYSISINAVIAVLVVILKIAILLVTAEGLSHLKFTWFKHQRPLVDLETYDMASRGPWGSLSLLLVIRHRHVGASMGAAVTLLALAVEPFTQQILRYHSCSVIDQSGNAGVPRAILYGAMGEHIGADLATVRVDMQSAINAGVYNANPPTVPVTCSTGNCTFTQPYHTVGFCSSCHNITNLLTVSSIVAGVLLSLTLLLSRSFLMFHLSFGTYSK